MKKYIFFGCVVAALLVSISLLLKSYKDVKEDRDRLYNNFEQYRVNTNRSIALTKMELDSYIMDNARLDSLIKKEKLKPSNIEWITETKHDYHRDTVEADVEGWLVNERVFTASYTDRCLSFSSSIDVVTPSVKLTNIEYSDNQTYIGHLKKKDTGRRFLWIFPIKKKVLELYVDSECGYSEVHHIQIKK